MSTSDTKRSSSSPVLPSPERSEIALSAVICTYNRYDLLPAAIESLVNQNLPADSFEVIVVDNSPDQASAVRFGQRYAGLSNLTYLVEPKPGLSNARNRGTAAARGRVVAFIDDDARVMWRWRHTLTRMYLLKYSFQNYNPREICRIVR